MPVLNPRYELYHAHHCNLHYCIWVVLHPHGGTYRLFLGGHHFCHHVAILNAILRPIFIILTLPITLFAFGLFLFVINAALILLTAEFCKGFRVDGFWWALLFSLLLSIITSVLYREDRSNKKAVPLILDDALSGLSFHVYIWPMQFNRKELTNEELVHFYKSLLLPRMIEEKMLVLLRQRQNIQMVQRYRSGSHCGGRRAGPGAGRMDHAIA